MTTPLFVIFQKRIGDSFENLIRVQVTPWVFLNSGRPMRVKQHNQSQISYEGIGFEGSPRNVFWSRYIEPFMEEICINEIDAAVQKAKDRHVDATLLLPEIEGLLLAGIWKTFSNMADVDQRLLGKGFPEKIPLRSIDKEYLIMRNFVEAHIRSELEMWRAKSHLQTWYEENKAAVWIVGVVLTIVGIAVNFV